MHGFPVRLIAPGWYGIATVKWLQRIDVLATRYENRFMARDYVTIREQQIDG
jgi:DMSO/TMAO reductase YedYZ molybdopterin-dependent catalytic subunit